MKKKVVVIGAGASGLFAAGIAAANGAEVVLIEKNDKPGRKLMITGKGRCNLTNNTQDLSELIKAVPTNGRFLYSAFSSFMPIDTMDFFEGLGVPLKTERGNRVFPVSDRAADIVDALTDFALGNCKFIKGRVKYFICEDSRIKAVKLQDSTQIEGDSFILATGGMSYKNTGSTGDGYVLALLLKEIDVPVTLFLLKDKFSEDGRYYFEKCMDAKIPYHLCDENTSFENYNIIVDCIFGTGFKGTARGTAGEIIDKINNSQGTVISVDINSGLNGDNGFSQKCVKSHTTVSIGYLKPGLLINDAPKYIGNLKNCDIGIELVGEYYVLQDNFPDISVKENTFDSLKGFSDCFSIPYETAYEKPVEVISSVAKEKNISVLVKNLGEYSVIISGNTAYIVRG